MGIFSHLLDEFHLPLSNPVLVFSIYLFIILGAPILLRKVKVPHVIGLIIAGAIIGPNGMNLLLRDSSVVLFGTVGLLYIMFMSSLEMDMADFKRNSSKSIVFGIYTFVVPMVFGTLSSYWVLNFSWTTSVLLASMYASNTLIAYPIVSKLGIVKNKAVNISVGGTMITTALALIVLAVIIGLKNGEIGSAFWIQMAISFTLFISFIMLLFPIVGRWFFKRYGDNVSQYIFVLAMVFLGAFLAQVAGTEPIIGAFFAGFALNKLVPKTSPLMNRLEFVGGALFIPFFLIGVGMLVDFKAFISDLDTIKVAVVMTVMATLSKYIAAVMTQKTYKLSKDEMYVIFGLSNAQAAATLAAVLVGYNVLLGTGPDGEPIRLLNDAVLNGTIVMILITCTISAIYTQKGAQRIALLDADTDSGETTHPEKILIPINNIENTEELVNLSVTIKSKKNKSGIYVLNVLSNSSLDASMEKNAKKILDKATVIAAATDNAVHPLLRYDINIVNGINNVVKEFKITDLILGLHKKNVLTDSFLGTVTDGILSKCDATTMVYKAAQPLSTIKRAVVVIPAKAEKELGFAFWLVKIWNIGRNTGAKLVFYANENTIDVIKKIHQKNPIDAEFYLFENYDDFLIVSRDIRTDDKLVVVLARKDMASYHTTMEKVPNYLNNYFQNNSFILIYPAQFKLSSDLNEDIENPYDFDPINKLDSVGRAILKLFGKN
jgi:Kef-type K+ transport system membrane component KefB/nucleotide-binding universal stress UspA family protein